jgi:hypothetical protein
MATGKAVMISRLSMAVALCMLANRAAAQSHARKLSSPKPDTDRIACIEDHKRVQTARESGQFLVSSEAAARCAQASCPLLIREDCATWYIELDRHTPSLVLDVRDPRGGDVAGPRVTLGERVLDVHGRAIALDPGTYELRVEAAGFEVRSERIVVRQDEKNRRVTLTLQPLGAPSVGRTSPTTSPAVITLGAFGLAGLGTFAALATAGKLRHSQLDDDSCKPGCDRRDVEGVNRMYLGANIAAAIGGSAAIAATVMFVRERKRARQLELAVGPLGLSLRGGF